MRIVLCDGIIFSLEIQCYDKANLHMRPEINERRRARENILVDIMVLSLKNKNKITYGNKLFYNYRISRESEARK